MTALTIKAVLRIVPNSRTPKRASRWSATCEWDGRTFEATSRSGATYSLCRALVAAGCPDLPMQVFGPDGRLQLTFPSIGAAAG